MLRNATINDVEIDLDAAGCRRLVAAMILRAVNDARSGRPCGWMCRRRGTHECAKEAQIWLVTIGALLADALDIAHPDTVRAWVSGRPAQPNLDK